MILNWLHNLNYKRGIEILLFYFWLKNKKSQDNNKKTCN
jgi:hypothetical protein